MRTRAQCPAAIAGRESIPQGVHDRTPEAGNPTPDAGNRTQETGTLEIIPDQTI